MAPEVDTSLGHSESKLSINELQVSKVFNLSNSQPYSIMDNGADTSVIGQGWYILGVYEFRKMNIIDFDSQASRKDVLRVVIAITAVELSNGQVILLKILEAAFNPNSVHSLLA